MAGESGRSRDSLIRDLERKPEEYGFFQAVRLLEIAAGVVPERTADPKTGPAQAAPRLDASMLDAAILGEPVLDAESRADASTLLDDSTHFDRSIEARRIRGAGEAAASRANLGLDQWAALGHDGPPNAEAVRLKSAPGLGFPAAEVRAFEPATSGPPRMSVNFLGVVGPQGVLPQHYTEFVLGRLAEKDDSALEFFDLFHHRTLSFFYRAWAKQAVPFTCSLEPDTPGVARRGIDPLTRCLLALTGSATAAAEREDVPETLLAFYAGHFAHQNRSPALLEQMLSEHFDLPLRVEQFVGRWLDIPIEEQTRMAGPTPGGTTPGLGQGMSAGARVWDVGSTVRLHAGPLRRVQFERIAPGTPGGRRMVALARRFLGPWIDFDLRVEIAPGEVPRFALGQADPIQPDSAQESPAPKRSTRQDPTQSAAPAEAATELRVVQRGNTQAQAGSAAARRSRLGQDTWLIGNPNGVTTGVALFKLD